MFCPKCRDEFRPGFTRCGRCNVDLVHELPARGAGFAASSRDATGPPIRMGEYCGFLTLDEARGARDRLRERRIRSDIVVRESPEADWDEPVREEFWLRVDVSRAREIAGVLGEVPEVEDEGEDDASTFACGECGRQVAEDESFCPGCGARFDD